MKVGELLSKARNAEHIKRFNTNEREFSVTCFRDESLYIANTTNIIYTICMKQKYIERQKTCQI